MTAPSPEAIEAAKAAHLEHKYLRPLDGPAHCGGCGWESRQIGVSSNTQHEWHRTKAALTAAAPFIAARALREAADEIRANQYDDLDPFYAEYLVSRAATIEGKDS